VSSTRTRTRPPVTDGLTPGTAVAVPRDSRLVPAVVGVTVVSLTGSVLAVASGLSADWWQAVGPTGRLSVPLPMNAALIVLGLVAAGRRRRLALAAASLLAAACTTAVVSGFFDGGFAAALSPVERLAQVALVLGLAVVAVLAGNRAVGLVRLERRGDTRA
jgi:hypothetical protein